MNAPSSTESPAAADASDPRGSTRPSSVKLPTVAIVGRPNVGKSTLFNRVIGGRRAIVDSEPGVTRDVHAARTEWAGRSFYIVDTGGILETVEGELEEAIRHQALEAVREADLILFMVDGRAGIHPLDQHIAELLRKQSAEVVLVVNKLDKLPEMMEAAEFYALGLGEPLGLAAISGKGSGDLLDRVVARLPETRGDSEPIAGLRLAVIGRPNVGKSSFINKVLGVERLVVSADAGTTRDAIDTRFGHGGRDLVFIDTAGLRRRSRVVTGLEYYAGLRTLRAIDRADVCMLLVDADEGVGNQDFRIAKMVWDRGRGLVFAVNKWDLIKKDTQTAPQFEKALRERAPLLSAVPIIFISALTGQRVLRALDVAWEVEEERSRRVPTRELNLRLQELTEAVQPPEPRGRPIKFFYATQARTAPPLFVIFTNRPKEVPRNYVRYLLNGFRQTWGFKGSPIRLRLRERRKARPA